MTKAQYLKSIGYKYSYHLDFYSWFMFEKIYEEFDGHFLRMCIDPDNNKYFVQIPSGRDIENQRQIDDLQIAFNNVKRDFDEMQKYD